MERFGATGLFPGYDPQPADPRRQALYQMQCHGCGFESADVITAPAVCPKCQGTVWERISLPGSILRNADRYPG
jgi:hypothetical protein